MPGRSLQRISELRLPFSQNARQAAKMAAAASVIAASAAHAVRKLAESKIHRKIVFLSVTGSICLTSGHFAGKYHEDRIRNIAMLAEDKRVSFVLSSCWDQCPEERCGVCRSPRAAHTADADPPRPLSTTGKSC